MSPLTPSHFLGALLVLLTACVNQEQRALVLPDPIRQEGFGTECESDADCTSGPCTPHAGTRVCSQPCAPLVLCPDAWSCVAPAGASDGAGICRSPFASLCRPCAANADCSEDLSKFEGCIDDDGQGSYCSTFCEFDTDCPSGYACLDRKTVAGGDVRACSRVDANDSPILCTCNAYLESLDTPALCRESNVLGTCPGTRMCIGGEWASCSANPPALDHPNGLDDDCDGDTDDVTCRCGDGTCDAACAETLQNCPCDCARESDGVCSPCGENPTTSPEDCCQSPGGFGCGDGYCLGFGCGENPESCPRDCSTPCGNQVCERGETPQTCPIDCKHQVCGNYICEPTDDGPTACPEDCGAFCGDCECEPARDESVFNCPIDCGFCGDGVCSVCSVLNESATTCPEDCCTGTVEFCNGIDDDCDGQADEEGATGCRDFYVDSDSDGLGRWDASRCLCEPEGQYRTSAFGDCDDDNPTIGRGTPETCNGEDEDCDGAIDEDFDTGKDCEAPSGACIEGALICDGLNATTCIDGPPRAAGTTCSTLSCEDGVIYPPSSCDGEGACIELPRAHCSGYDCNTSGRCLDRCASDADCRNGFVCSVEGLCQRTASLCENDRACIDEDFTTEDFCLVICVHRPRADRRPSGDVDGDGLANDKDLCPETADPAQGDADADGRGDACDPCSGTDTTERCNGRDDDCDGDIDEGFGVGLSCIPEGHPCEHGLRTCRDGIAFCESSGPAPPGRVCAEARCEGANIRLEGRCNETGICESGTVVNCQGFPCIDGNDTPRCATNCDPECAPGYYCVPSETGGICAPKFINGTACGSDSQCRSGHCVDGVCCVSTCETPCYTCARSDALGACVPAAPDTDPKEDCGPCALCDGVGHCAPVSEGPSPKATCPVTPPCGGVGTCDGEGACSLAPAGTECLPEACLGSTLRPRAVCDGAGMCEQPDSSPCPGDFACQGDLSCRETCTNDQHCREGHFCDRNSNRCLALYALGAACSNDGECESRFCVDGVCCESNCTGPCKTCSGRVPGRCDLEAAGTDPGDECGLCRACDGTGECRAIDIGMDPQHECVATPPCGPTGACDGAGGCAVAPVETPCGEARCLGSTLLEGRRCDGDGQCEDPRLSSCTPYVCAENGRACATTCTSDGDCQSGYFCTSARTCEEKRGLGLACTSMSQCASGHCADGRCCESACNGLCEACDGAGQCEDIDGEDPLCAVGLCVAGDCRRGLGERCEIGSECASGFCVDGSCCDSACNGECQNCATGTCGPLAGVESAECGAGRWCSAAGRCEEVDGSPCVSECPDGRTCVEGACVLPGGLGINCTEAAGCRSGFCVDGICCSEPCNGECVECVAGFCEPLDSGAEDPGRCGGACDGDGGCRLDDGESCASSGDCASGFCVDGMCCGTACSGECERCVEGVCQGVEGATDAGTCEPPSICAGRDRCASGAGQPCTLDGDCVSGACILVTETVGFCCDSACAGPCQTCFGEQTGRCDAVTRAENPGRCEGTSWCSSDGACTAKDGSSCINSTDCDEGFFCNIAIGKCEGLKARGADCTDDGSCGSGFCVDGRCCETACDGLCEACNASGRCEPAASGTDPDEDCPAGETCSREALGCAGERGQQCLVEGECASGYCADGVCCDRSCSGACETCIDQPGTCENVTNAETGRCEGAFVCDAVGACRAALGMACEEDAECSSDLCGESGTCCAAGCNSPCEQCEVSGQCARVESAENPGRCEGAQACDSTAQCVEKARACGSDGDCTSDYHCSLARCVADVVAGQSCGGDGQCESGFCREGRCCESDCQGRCETCARAGYEGQCVPAEAGTNPHASCLSPAVCSASQTCGRIDGVVCDNDTQCMSGFCTDGVCCNMECNEVCTNCATSGALGLCRPSNGDDSTCQGTSTCVEGQCLKDIGISCLQDRECGSAHCEDANTDSTFEGACCEGSCEGPCTTCASGRCVALTETVDSECRGEGQWCDISGQCRAITGSRCEGDDDCPETHFCSANACTPLRALGAACSGATQCASGFCADGRCCESACGGPCDICDASGQCELADVGTSGECGIGTACNASGGCGNLNGSSCANDAACASGLCRDGVCCSSPCDGSCQRCGVGGLCGALTNQTDPGLCEGNSVCDGSGTCRLANGVVCAQDIDCASAQCVDGVCCESECSGACLSCTLSGNIGFCSTVQFDNDAQCGPGKWCGEDGICIDPLGEPCLDETQCPEVLVCADPSDLGFEICSPPFSDGAGCNSSTDCESGFCVDGVCCSTVCSGSCQACDIVRGSCTPLSGVPDSCPSGQQCQNGSCVGSSGSCGTQTCAPGTVCVDGVCEPSGEVFACDNNDDCPSGLCVNHVCAPQF